MAKFFVSLLLILAVTTSAFAQECGPSCPVCSGAGNNDGALIPQKSLTVSALSIPTGDEERTVLKTRYGISSWLDAGAGYAFRTEKVLWSVIAQPIKEQKNSWRPGVVLGTGSVQAGGSDQSLFLQLIKSWDMSRNVGLQLSAGTATLLPDFDEVYGLAGITGSLFDRYSAFVSYDGKSYHQGISWTPSKSLALSLLLVESEYPALSISFKR